MVFVQYRYRHTYVGKETRVRGKVVRAYALDRGEYDSGHCIAAISIRNPHFVRTSIVTTSESIFTKSRRLPQKKWFEGSLIIEKDHFARGFFEESSRIPQKMQRFLKNRGKTSEIFVLEKNGFEEFVSLVLENKRFEGEDSHIWRGPRVNTSTLTTPSS